MIDDIVDMVLKEARGYFYLGKAQSVAIVKRQIEMQLNDIINIYEDEERRKEEDEN